MAPAERQPLRRPTCLAMPCFCMSRLNLPISYFQLCNTLSLKQMANSFEEILTIDFIHARQDFKNIFNTKASIFNEVYIILHSDKIYTRYTYINSEPHSQLTKRHAVQQFKRRLDSANFICK